MKRRLCGSPGDCEQLRCLRQRLHRPRQRRIGGLRLAEDGTVGGSFERAGRYLWLVELSEADGGDRVSCPIAAEALASGRIHVTTRALGTAIVGNRYTVRLQATAEAEALWWRIDGGRLPDGLTLRSDGEIDGVPSANALEGAGSRDFDLLVHVRDDEGRAGHAALSLRLEEAPTEAPRKEAESGCQAAAGGLGFTGLIFAMALLSRMRRQGSPLE